MGIHTHTHTRIVDSHTAQVSGQSVRMHDTNGQARTYTRTHFALKNAYTATKTGRDKNQPGHECAGENSRSQH